MAQIAAIIGAGSGLTLISLIIVVSFGPLQRIENLINPPKKTLADFPESPADIDIIKEIEALDKDAKAILVGAGPKEMIVAGRLWKVGDVVYADEREWIEEVYPHDTRQDSTSGEQCGIGPPGKLTVRGFSIKRKSALIKYTTSDSGAGALCASGVYFFYPIE